MSIPDARLARLAAENRASEPTLAGHAAVIAELADLAMSAIGSGDVDGAAYLAAVAAEFGWLNHPGTFRHAALEEMLDRLAVTAFADATPVRLRDTLSGRGVVHVLTHAAELGGHTRLAWRWISFDADRRHSVVLTQAANEAVPAPLTTAVHQSGGQVIRLAGPSRQRLASLARTVREADAVVLHIDPGDVVAVAAVRPTDRPPVTFVNHADHVLWAGAGSADALASIRASGTDLAVRRRGIPASRVQLVPIPIPGTADRPSTDARAAARERYGIPAGAIVVTSVASSYKFRPIGGFGMVEVADAIVADPRFVLLVAGPSPSGVWAELENRTAGRARAVGPVADLAGLFAAADLHLDAYPFASLTSLLEAGSHGLPLLALQDHPEDCAVLSSDSPGLGDLVIARSVPELVASLSELADRPSERRDLGLRTAATIAASHAGPPWRASLEAADALARRVAPGRDGSSPDGEPRNERPEVGEPSRLDVLLVELHRGLGGLDGAVARRVADRTIVGRLRVAATFGRDVRRAAIRATVPSPLRLAVRRIVGGSR